MKRSTKCFLTMIPTVFLLVASILASAFLFESCSWFIHNDEPEEKTEEVTAISFASSSVSVAKGGNTYLKYYVKPSDIQNKVSVNWSYDSSIINIDADHNGVIITGLKKGQTYLKATANNITATSLITVEGSDDVYEGDPYIYSNFTVVELTPGSNTTVSASLYGGTSTDLEDFVWSIKDPTIASIDSARGSCVVTAKKTGSTQITVSHPNATYDYTMILYVYSDTLTASYITTSQNIVVINKADISSKTVTFSVANPVTSNYERGFSYEIITENGDDCCSVIGNGSTAILKPLKNGLSVLRVTHENCEYTLDVLVKITTAVENVYIVPSTTTLIVNGSDDSYSIYADIVGTDKFINPDAFEWILFDENGNEISENDCSDYMECKASGNQFSVTGKKNGAFKVKIRHELSEYSRTVLIILRNQAGSAIDASMYITTSENYVKTQVGAETTKITVSVMGGEAGDENDLVWKIDNGENNDICKIITPTGKVSARAAGSITDGYLYITPLKAGTATISVSHPNILYSTDIVVKVLSEYALIEEPVYINSDTSLIKMLNGATKEVSVNLTGNTASGDENGIMWESDNSSVISVSPSIGSTVQLSANGSGQQQTYVKASHTKALSEKKILVLSADTTEELEAMKGFYADTTYYRINVDGTCEIEMNQFGLESSDIQKISWSSSDSSICMVNASSVSHLKATVTGTATGTATVTASLSGCEDCVFNITVLPEGEEIGVVTSKYLTTTKNAVVISTVGDTANLSVTGVNISDSDMASYTNWQVEDASIATVVGNGSSAVVTAVSEGKTRVNISNSVSENSISIEIKVGALYEWADDYYVYITTEEDTVTMVKGDTKTIGAALENSTAKNGFNWSVTGKSGIIEATGNPAGTCYIEAIEAGMTELTIRNTNADFEKTVLVVVANTAEELADIMYLTTTQNVVTIGETYNETVTASIANAKSNIIDGYHWESSEPSIIRVVESGSTAVFYGISQGTAKITVTNDYCDYPLKIIANCVDPILAAANPYITSQNIVTLTVGDSATTLTADLVGGTESDYANFTWHCQDSGIATLYSSNETAQIKAVSAGTTQVVISHPKAGGVDRTILVICEPKSEEDCYITVTESIIKMSPSDSSKTITATLVNGTASDVYNFKWWADSYDIIDMNYTSESCVITPIATGNVTIHCSHPKASNQKDIVLYISQYSEFAFEKTSVSLTKGTKSFVNMEVPATSVSTKVVYSAKYTNETSASDLMSVSGTNSVCILDPVKAGTCVVYADLVATSSGIKQATAQLLVNIEESAADVTYINYSGATVITLEKGETQTLSATLAGTKAATGDEKYLKWKSSDPSIVEITPSPSSSGYTMNNQIKITGKKAGQEATVTISCDKYDGISNVILYVIVPGENVANILLDRSAMNLIMGDNAQSITASITNAADGDYENLEWTVQQDSDNPVVKLSGSGKKISIYPQSVGSAVITATVPSSLRKATCTVTVEPPKQIILSMNSINCYPGEEFKITYTVSPESEMNSITWTTTDSSYVGWSDDKKGTLTCYGKYNEGTCTITGTTASKAKASITITNEWGNTLNLSKSYIKTIPVDKGDGTFDVDFELKPACAELHIQGTQFQTGSETLQLKSGTYSTYDGSMGIYKIKSEKFTRIDEQTGTAYGTIHLVPLGESKGNIEVIAYNPVSIDGNAPLGEIAVNNIEANIYYTTQDFNFSYFYTDGKYSSFDYDTKILTVGDGETVTFKVGSNNVNATLNITGATFSSPSDSYSTSKIKTKSGTTPMIGDGKPLVESGTNSSGFKFKFADDFCLSKGFYNADNTDKAAELNNQFNTVRLEHLYIGTLDIKYKPVYTSSELTYSIPVYLDIRNCMYNYK